MVALIQNYERNRRLAELDDRTDAELFTLLGDETQDRIIANFRAGLDEADLEAAVMNNVRGKIRPRDAGYFAGRWHSHLERLNLRQRYATELERNIDGEQ